MKRLSPSSHQGNANKSCSYNSQDSCRYPTAIANKEDTKEKFTTTWRPQTTFGYKKDFAYAKYERLNSTPYTYKSSPHIVK